MSPNNSDIIKGTVTVEAPREVIEAMRDVYDDESELAAARANECDIEYELRPSKWSARIG